MNYNIAKNSLVAVDTDETTVDLSSYQLLQILDVSEDPIATLSGSDKFVLDCDLGSRIHLSEIVYHFKSSYVPAGTVTFYYKNEPFQDYTDLVSYMEADGDGYRTTLSGSINSGPFAPRYVRLEHDLTTVSGYVSGDIYGFETLNDDNIVDFGTDGAATQTDFEVARGGLDQVQTIPIYNDGESIVDALINLEPTYTDTDNIMSIGLTDEGPWKKALETDSLVHDETNFDDGESYRLSTDGDAKIMTMFKDYDGARTHRYSTGQYTSRLFRLEPYTQNRILMQYDENQDGYHTYDSDHLVQTIKVRSSKQKPRDYNIYRELYQFYSGNLWYLAYRDRWTNTSSIKENHTWGFMTVDRYTYWRDHQIQMDFNTERTAGFAYSFGWDSASDSHLRIFNNIGTTAKYTTVADRDGANAYINYTVHHIVLDQTGGLWVYFYCQSYSSSQFVNQTGYYLAYFNSNMSNTFKYFLNSKFAQDMDSDYGTGTLWYTYPGSETIVVVNNEGDTLYTIANDDTDYLGGITVLSDGNVWYANDGDLIKLNSQAGEEDRINDMLEDLEVYDKLATDPDTDEAIWAIWGFNVYRIFLSGENRGTYDMSFYIEGALHIWPIKGGCWVWQADISGAGFNRVHYISKENRRVDRNIKVNDAHTTSSTEPSSSWIAPLNIYWNDDNYLEKMPLDIDTEWSTLEYESVPVENYILAEDHEYYQMKAYFERETAEVQHGSPTGSTYINDDYFDHEDGPPLNTQLWGRWSSDDYIYVENSNLIMKGGTTCWIDTYKRMLVQPNSTLNCSYRFSLGENPVSVQQHMYIFLYSMDSGHSGEYWRAYVRYDTDGGVFMEIRNSDGSNAGTHSSGSVNATDTGVRIHKNTSGRFYAAYYNNGSWHYTSSYVSDTNQMGDHYYVRLYKANTALDATVFNYITDYNALPWYYTDSPRLISIYTQESMELTEIYPKASKNIYARAQVALADDVKAQEEIDLRVKWRQPVP